MNDREQLLDLKRQAETQGKMSPLEQMMRPQTPEQVIESVVWKSKLTRVYFESLIRLGFTETDALYLTAHSDL